MISIGTIAAMAGIATQPLKHGTICSKCGYNDDYAVVTYPIYEPTFQPISTSIDIIYYASALILIAWDAVH